MRVIAGIAKGHKLVAPEGLDTRPTTDRIKETMFNIISSNINIYEKSVLDLFCGSGAVGIEALSRGADKSFFVDWDEMAINSLNQNLEHTKLKDKSVVIKNDVFRALKKFNDDKESFDIIFMDPPYALGLNETVLKEIIDLKLIKKDGIVITEQPSKGALTEIDGLELIKQKDYKTTIMSFWTLGD